MRSILIILLWTWVVSPVSAQQSKPSDAPVPEVDSNWSGVKFGITNVIRLDSKTVMMAIRLKADSSAKNPTFIGYVDKKGNPADKNHGGPPQGIPFMLTEASLVDKLSNQLVHTSPPPPGQRTFGPDGALTTMGPSSWFQLSVQFPLPVPPPNQDGTVPVQKVDVMLPEAKGPIKSVVIPPLLKSFNSSHT